MKEEQLPAEETLTLLGENARRLRLLTDGIPVDRLHRAPKPNAWSANEILAHIRACCDVWGSNIAAILAEDRPMIAGVNPRTYMKRTDFLDWPFEKAVRAFLAQREELLRRLEGLTPEDWERGAIVVSYGQSNERSVRSYASQLAKHERTHVRQIDRTLNPNGEGNPKTGGAQRSSSARSNRRRTATSW